MSPDRPRQPAGDPESVRAALRDGRLIDYGVEKAVDVATNAILGVVDALNHPSRTLAAGAAAVSDGATGLYQALGKLWDGLAPSISEAVSDIAKKVFEEGWFGREVTPRELSLPASHDVQGSPLGFKELMQLQAAMLPANRDRSSVDPEVSGPER